MDYFTKWPEVYAIPNQEESTVTEALVTFFCRFGIPREVHSDQGRNFESHLLHEVLQRLGVSKTRTTALHPQSDGMVERYIKPIEEHLRKVVASHQRDWDEGLPLFLLVCRASTHDTTGLTPDSLVFGQELRMPYDLLFGVPPEKERPTTDYTAELVDQLYDIHNFALQNPKLASDRIKTLYDILANSVCYQEGDRRTKGKSPKLQSSWEGPYRIVTRINNVLNRIQKDPRSRMMVIHLDLLAPYQGAARDECT
jgi:hypothetical protein